MRNDLRVTELDFERIKSNFKRFMKSQDEYTEYDFDASGFDVIFDVLAYNTHYNAVYMNNAINESYIISAGDRQNVTKGAQSLNYLPKSMTASRIYVDLEVQIPESTLVSIFGSTDYGLVQLESGNIFTTKIDNTTYRFLNRTAVDLEQTGDTTFQAESVELIQGASSTFSFTVDGSNDFQRFVIPERNIDLETMTVFSIVSGDLEPKRYVFHKDSNLQDISSTTPVYFLSENGNEEYEIEFGDGRYGYKPVGGEVITLSYIVTKGKDANGAIQFSAANNIVVSGNTINDATVNVSPRGRSFGGSDRESTESIRYNAPKYYQTQDRAVVNNDYASIIRKNFLNVETVNVWGGEDNLPPRYGKVLIAAKPYGSLYFTETEKTLISDLIQEKMVGSIKPILVDPKYTDLVANVTIKYDSKKTLKRTSDIKNRAIDMLVEYSKDNIEKFKTVVYSSQISEKLKQIDKSIESVILDFEMKKSFNPTLNVATSYTFYFQNKIYYPYTGFRGSITSSTFSYGGFTDCTIRQSETGSLSVVTRSNNVDVEVVSDIGSVDYTNGVVILNAFAPESYTGTFLRIFAQPNSQDVESYREFILRIQQPDVNTNIVDITTIGSMTNSLTSRSTGSDITVDVSSTSF